ncbi:tripartite tricarboxylate transporter TctB family protein [Plantactinospora veratri]
MLGTVLLAAGLFLLWTAYRAADGDYSVAGPWLAPLVVTTGWVVLAGWYLIDQFRTPPRAEPAGTEPEAEQASPVRWLPPALLCAALLGYVLLLEPAGFVLSSALFFVACARILGSRRWVRDIAVAAPLVAGVYYGFTRGLDIALPAGVLPL